VWNAVLSDQQISNFIRLNIERGDSFHEILGDDCRVWKNITGSRAAVVRAVISTDSPHLQGNSVDICTAGYVEYSNNPEAQKAAEQAPSTVAPSCPTLKILNSSSCKSHQSTNQDQTK
jgi:hypothetical protein